MKQKKGFACMTQEQRREIARMGGIAAHKMGKGHQFTKQEASEASLKSWENRKKKAFK